MAHLVDYNTQTRYKAKVLKTKRMTPIDTHEVREIQLEVKQGAFDCHIDQSFGVLLPVKTEFGNHEHHRLYSVSDLPEKKNKKTQLTFLVKRCTYVDDFSGELYHGISSNYLCDRKPGDEITITGPFELPFSVPDDKTSNLILVGMGTGIAPFRAFIKHIYKHEKDWKGQIQLFYGAKSGLELLYLNDKDGDLTNYYDQETFEAFQALSPRPQWDDPIALETTIIDQAEKVLKALSQANTYIYVAGYVKVKDKLDEAFSEIMRSKEKWQTRKAELIAGKKWAEIIY